MLFTDCEGLNGLYRNEEWEEDSSGPGNYFYRDPLYYYKRLYDFNKVRETPLAYLLKDEGGEYWIPKSLLKFYGDTEIYIWKGFIKEYIK